VPQFGQSFQAIFLIIKIGMQWNELVEKKIEPSYRQALRIFEDAKSSEGKAKTDIVNEKREFEDKKKDFLHEKYDIMEDVLNKPMPRFSLLPGFVVRSRLYKKLAKRRLLDAGVSSDSRNSPD
jgi:hypothetical protein